jgi:hypothetical protein
MIRREMESRESPSDEARSSGGRGEIKAAVAALALYAALAVGMTWPLARSPGTLLHANGDVFGNAWAVAWVAHQAFKDPLHLFDANMFFPHTKSLAYAESLVPQGMQGAPVLALGGSVPLAYNLVFLLTFPLSGLGAYLLARDLGASRSGGFLAGLGFGFCAYRWDHVVHVQSLSTQWLPFAVLFLLRVLRRGRGWDGVGLAGATLLQILSSGYFAFVTAVALGIVLLCEGGPAWRRARLRGALLALAAAGLLAAPVVGQHRVVVKRHAMTRKVAELHLWSAVPRSYLDPGPYALAPHARWMHEHFEHREPLSPGVLFLGLGLLGATLLWRTPGGRLALLLALAGVALSFGPVWRVHGITLPGPFAFIRLLPGGDLLRTPSRFGILGVLGLSLLTALVWTRLASRANARAERVALALACGFAIFEAWPAGLGRLVHEAPVAPPAIAWLASAPRGPVLELPWTEPGGSAVYVYWSTQHWQPLVNGFGSFEPPGNFAVGLLGQRWPSGYTSRIFRSEGIRYVVVHTDRLPPEARIRTVTMESLPEGVSLAADLGPDLVYEIDPAGPGPREKERGPQLD